MEVGAIGRDEPLDWGVCGRLPDSRGMNMPLIDRAIRNQRAGLCVMLAAMAGSAWMGGCEAGLNGTVGSGRAAALKEGGSGASTTSTGGATKGAGAITVSDSTAASVTVGDAAQAKSEQLVAGGASAPVNTAAQKPTIPVTTVSAAPVDEFEGAMQSPRFEVVSGAEPLSGYKRFVVDAVAVRLAPNAGDAALNPDELKHLSDSFRTHLRENLGELMESSQDSGPETLRLRCTLGRLTAGQAGAGDGALSLASAGCKVEVQDSVTGKTLATFVDASTPPRLAAKRSGADLNKACLRQWGELFVQRMDEARSK